MFLLDIVGQAFAKEAPGDKKLKKINLKKNYFIPLKQIRQLKKEENLISYFVSKMIAFYDTEFEKIKQYPEFYRIIKLDNKYTIFWYVEDNKQKNE